MVDFVPLFTNFQNRVGSLAFFNNNQFAIFLIILKLKFKKIFLVGDWVG